ncbi:MAG: sel1 repeat family protein, partial [Cyanobacteria bacterium HKST-UBA01]|nr:sel1 repeat family protein [Cyanobacteria bacterium HKST-UBA01]
RGYAPALVKVAEMFRDGSGVPVDETQAYELFLRAASSGSRKGQLELARIHAGRNSKEDLVQAYKWYSIAATGSDDLSNSAKNERDQLRKKMDTESILEAQRLASSAWDSNITSI